MKSWNYFGNEWAVALLKKHVSLDKVRHAYLISGPNGIGRRTLALRLAQTIFCQSVVNNEPCLSCPSCKKVFEESYYDLKVIKRMPGSKDIKIEQVREVEAFLRITPFGGQKKIVIFTDFDLANQSTQNALLKTLEEAPAYSVLILIAENPAALLPTVISRCEAIDLRPERDGVIEEFLREKRAAESEIMLLASLAEGRPGVAYELAFNGEDVLKDRIESIQDLIQLLKKPLHERFIYADELTKKDNKAREQAKTRAKKIQSAKNSNKNIDTDQTEDDDLSEGIIQKNLLTWLHLFADVYSSSLSMKDAMVNIDFRDQIYGLAAKLGAEKSLDCVNYVSDAIEQERKNVNKRLLLENLFLKIPEIP